MIFDYEYVESFDAIRAQVKECEGPHPQQVIFSTYHGALTQICFGCRKVRSNLYTEGGAAMRW